MVRGSERQDRRNVQNKLNRFQLEAMDLDQFTVLTTFGTVPPRLDGRVRHRYPVRRYFWQDSCLKPLR